MRDNILMDKVEISLKDARKFIVNSQLLGKGSEKKSEELIDIFDHLGYIQIDTISRINRSHHHTLWTRDQNYKEECLFDLQSKEKKIFEYWGHAMSFLPMSDYRFIIPKMDNFKNPSSIWVKNHLAKSKDHIQIVLDRIKDEGPLSTKDFESDKKKRGWWDWKPAKFALEYLFWRGDLMVKERKGFRKIYDLTERILPDNINIKKPDKRELGDFLVKKALGALGIAAEKEIASFMQSSATRDPELMVADKVIIRDSIQGLIDVGEIIEVQINGRQGRMYSLAKKINAFNPDEDIDANIHFLSPFDNMIIGRKRVEELFNFSYTLECYKPAVKRKYGYFVLPILFKDNLVGRLDPKADRKKKMLYIDNLVFEMQFDPDQEFLTLMAEKLVSFAKFNNCENVEIINSSQSKALIKLIALIKDSLEKRMVDAC